MAKSSRPALLPVGYPLFGVALEHDKPDAQAPREWFAVGDPELIVGWALYWNPEAEEYTPPLPIYAESGEGGNFFAIGATPEDAQKHAQDRIDWLTKQRIGFH